MNYLTIALEVNWKILLSFVIHSYAKVCRGPHPFDDIYESTVISSRVPHL